MVFGIFWKKYVCFFFVFYFMIDICFDFKIFVGVYLSVKIKYVYGWNNGYVDDFWDSFNNGWFDVVSNSDVGFW